MRKIIVKFNSSRKIQKLKKIMKGVYTSGFNDGTRLARFNLNKIFAPNKVENAEIEINKIIGSGTAVTLPKTSLTFLTAEPPFELVEGACEIEGNYIVLPWNITTLSGENGLKALINKISTSTTSLKYTINVSTNENESGVDTISNAELSLSDNSFEDNTEELFYKIQELENNIRMLDQELSNANFEITKEQKLIGQKDSQISGLNSQVSSLNSQLIGLRNTNQSQTNQINGLNNRIAELSSNQVTWDQRVANQTILDFVGFTGRVIAKINPSNGTFSVNVY